LVESDFKTMLSLPIRFPAVAQERLELDKLGQSQNQSFGTRLDRETFDYLFQEKIHCRRQLPYIWRFAFGPAAAGGLAFSVPLSEFHARRLSAIQPLYHAKHRQTPMNVTTAPGPGALREFRRLAGVPRAPGAAQV
jgi:hypothetical protein